MKYLILITLLFTTISSTALYSQGGRFKGLSKLAKSAWRTVEGAGTAKEIYDWVNESRSTSNYYLNPNGRWKSTSGKIFDVQETSYGLVYRDAFNGTMVYCNSTGIANFYYAERPEAHYYVTVVDRNKIIINTCQGDEFKWWRM